VLRSLMDVGVDAGACSGPGPTESTERGVLEGGEGLSCADGLPEALAAELKLGEPAACSRPLPASVLIHWKEYGDPAGGCFVTERWRPWCHQRRSPPNGKATPW